MGLQQMGQGLPISQTGAKSPRAGEPLDVDGKWAGVARLRNGPRIQVVNMVGTYFTSGSLARRRRRRRRRAVAATASNMIMLARTHVH